MIVCKNCGVELEQDMHICPLCNEPVNGKAAAPMPGNDVKQIFLRGEGLIVPRKKFAWEIVSLILLSASIVVFIVDYLINKAITWSEYPAATCFIIFFYVSLFTFWKQRAMVQIAGGALLSALSMVVVDAFTGGIDWSIKLGIPLLFISNLVIAGLLTVIRISKYKGVNLIAYAFLGAALLCMGIEAVLSFFKTGTIHLAWSIIVAACIIPIVLVLVFVHFRMKKGRSLKKTFHV